MHTFVKIGFIFVGLLAASACAERRTRLWIDPPRGYESAATRNIYYQVEDVQSGKKEALSIPVDQTPSDLVVEDHKASTGKDDAASEATSADRIIRDGKLPAAKPTAAVTISYLRGLQEVESLYGKHQFNEALVKIAPLVEQYPSQPRLFAMQGTLYRRIGERRLALQAYRRARELDQDNSEIEEAYLRLADETGDAGTGRMTQ